MPSQWNNFRMGNDLLIPFQSIPVKPATGKNTRHSDKKQDSINLREDKKITGSLKPELVYPKETKPAFSDDTKAELKFFDIGIKEFLDGPVKETEFDSQVFIDLPEKTIKNLEVMITRLKKQGFENLDITSRRMGDNTFNVDIICRDSGNVLYAERVIEPPKDIEKFVIKDDDDLERGF